MTFPSNLIRLGILLTMASIISAKLGLDPEMTVDRMKAMWLDNNELAKAKACFREIGPCTPLLKNLTALLPKVYRTACAACDYRERQVYRIGSRNSYLRDLAYFNALVNKIDPNHIYIDAYKNFILDMYN